MNKKSEIRVSVRNLVEFVMRSGDLDNRFVGTSRAVEGTKAHQKIQKSYKENYDAEVSLKYKIEYKDFTVIIEGRADGILVEDEEIIVDEIKTTTRPMEFVEENSLHLAQAKCYAYIYCVQNNLHEIGVQLTYFQLESEEIKYFRKKLSVEELKTFFEELIQKYFVWNKLTVKWNKKRDVSIKELKFPFENYRKGQRKLAVSVYSSIAHKKKLFVKAPTGIGKTISTLFPAVKAIGEGLASKIFYLTAKTITRKVAEDSFQKMRDMGLKFKTITLTAKDKICFEKEAACNPESCPYAKGHFDRVNDALSDVLKNETNFTREVIERYSKEYKICPFEFSLELTLWADSVICDYNYVFDPRVYLKRFFMDNSGEYIFLIDEAHNLVDRARNMFSSELSKRTFMELKKVTKDSQPKIYKAINKLNLYMIKMAKTCEEGNVKIQKEQPSDIYVLLRKFIQQAEEYLVKNNKGEGQEELLQLYFDSLAFIRISEMYDERYITYFEKKGKDFIIKLFCLDPSYLLNEACKRGKSSIFFSATLTPIKYFREILGGEQEDYSVILNSPFDKKNLNLMIADNISTKYKYREYSYERIVEYIISVYIAHKGNYFIFFPSYKYMRDVGEIFCEKYPGIDVIFQENHMTEQEREEFLKRFEGNSEKAVLAFSVLGGIFGEGIDLTGDRLIGAIIVGVGLPQICTERNVIKDYFNNKNGAGFEYSYTYPGMNKVMQAAGRVIRTEKDRGTVLLIDDRFNTSGYRRLFPVEWLDRKRVRSKEEVKNNVKQFWM